MLLLLASLLIPTSLASEKPRTISALARMAEAKYDLPTGILSAIIKVESCGQVNALNEDDGTRAQRAVGLRVASHGLMQIQMATARHVKFLGTAKELRRPATNIEVGARLMRHLLDSHKNDLALAITCYNSGEYSAACKQKKYNQHVGKIMNAWVRK